LKTLVQWLGWNPLYRRRAVPDPITLPNDHHTSRTAPRPGTRPDTRPFFTSNNTFPGTLLNSKKCGNASDTTEVACPFGRARLLPSRVFVRAPARREPRPPPSRQMGVALQIMRIPVPAPHGST